MPAGNMTYETNPLRVIAVPTGVRSQTTNRDDHSIVDTWLPTSRFVQAIDEQGHAIGEPFLMEQRLFEALFHEVMTP